MARVFAVMVQSFIEHYACRGTSLISGTDLSRCNKCYKMGTGAVSRYKLSRSQKSVTVQDFNCVQMRALTAVASAKAGVRVQRPLQICLGCRSKSKNCDKQLTHIVRVIKRYIFKIYNPMFLLRLSRRIGIFLEFIDFSNSLKPIILNQILM